MMSMKSIGGRTVRWKIIAGCDVYVVLISGASIQTVILISHLESRRILSALQLLFLFGARC